MGERDHSITCKACGLQRGGLNSYQCDCGPYRKEPLKSSLHQARHDAWSPDELKAHMVDLVNEISSFKGRPVSPLDVALELLSGELKSFVLFGHIGHLGPPLPDGKFQVGILEFGAKDSEVRATIRRVVQQWAAEQEDCS